MGAGTSGSAEVQGVGAGRSGSVGVEGEGAGGSGSVEVEGEGVEEGVGLPSTSEEAGTVTIGAMADE